MRFIILKSEPKLGKYRTHEELEATHLEGLDVTQVDYSAQLDYSAQ